MVNPLKSPGEVMPATADGFTVIEKLMGVPVQPVLFVGVTIIVAETGLPVLFMAVNEGILPVPLADKPIPDVLLVHVKLLPVPVKLIAVVGEPSLTVWLAIGLTVGNAFTVPLTATFCAVAPGEVITMFPEIFPIGAEADEPRDVAQDELYLEDGCRRHLALVRC